MNIQYYLARVLSNFFNPRAIKNSEVSQNSKVSFGCQVVHSEIGDYSYIGENSKVINCKIDKFCSIADNVTIGGATHPMSWVSTSPVFCKGRNALNQNFSNHSFKAYKTTIIENDVWIGSHALIKAGVKLGNGSVIGMGSVVTKDVPAYSIVAGNPAKILRYRFSHEVIESLIESCWWEWDKSKIHEYGSFFNDTATMLQRFEEKKNE